MIITTKDVILLITGILGGHFLSTYLRKKRENNEETKDTKKSIII